MKTRHKVISIEYDLGIEEKYFKAMVTKYPPPGMSTSPITKEFNTLEEAMLYLHGQLSQYLFREVIEEAMLAMTPVPKRGN